MTPKMKTLSNKATLINRDGYIEARGLTVVAHPATATTVASIQVGRTEHRVDDLEVSTDRIRSKLAGWEAVLK